MRKTNGPGDCKNDSFNSSNKTKPRILTQAQHNWLEFAWPKVAQNLVSGLKILPDRTCFRLRLRSAWHVLCHSCFVRNSLYIWVVMEKDSVSQHGMTNNESCWTWFSIFFWMTSVAFLLNCELERFRIVAWNDPKKSILSCAFHLLSGLIEDKRIKTTRFVSHEFNLCIDLLWKKLGAKVLEHKTELALRSIIISFYL